METFPPLGISPTEALKLAIARAGGQVKFGLLVGKAQNSVSKRKNSGKPLWHDKILLVERATGVSRHDLDPDIYPIERTNLESPGMGSGGAPAAYPSNTAAGAGLPAETQA